MVEIYPMAQYKMDTLMLAICNVTRQACICDIRIGDVILVQCNDINYVFGL